MHPCRSHIVGRHGLIVALTTLLAGGTVSAAVWSAWHHRQEFQVPAPGLIKFPLPPATLGAARADLADLPVGELAIDLAEPLFRRPVRFSVRHIQDHVLQEKVLTTHPIYRVALEGQPAAVRLSLALDLAVASLELVRGLHNGGSPPLQINGVRARRPPIYRVCLARRAGWFALFSGNPLCVAPRHEVGLQNLDVSSAATLPIALSLLAANPVYRPAEPLPQMPDTGAALDVTGWRYRKPVNLERPGVQQLELDWEVLAHAQTTLADLRLVRGDRQVPYVIERTGLRRSLTPHVVLVADPRRPRVSRWQLKLPYRRLPVSELSCSSPTPLFRRYLTLEEEATDERGAKYRRTLGRVWWEQSPERIGQTLRLALDAAPLTDTLWLQTDNEDNPPIVLTHFELACPVPRLFFTALSTNATWLYYGQPRAAAPRYDLSLATEQLLRAEKSPATLGPQEQLTKRAWTETARGGPVLWLVLGLVVVALLILISRLMPKPAEPGP